MKRYDTLELSDPATYLADDELAAVARKVATIHFEAVFAGKMGRGDAKKSVMNGEHHRDCLLRLFWIVWIRKADL